MDETINLKYKSDANLISELKNYVREERELLTRILKYLQEVEPRQLYLARGHSSLFAFLTTDLGYSESAAQRRIQAMRLLRDLPEIEEKIEKGTLSLSVASQVQGYFQQENKKRIEENQEKLSLLEKLNLVKHLEGTSARKCELQLAQISPETKLPKEKTRPLTPEKVLIQFLANPSLMGKIQKLKSLLSHQNPEGGLDFLFEKALDMALEKLDPERRAVRRENRRILRERSTVQSPPTSAVDPSSPNKSSRYIPQPLRDRIWKRDQGRCQYRDPKSGKICGSNYLLEIDHRQPFALGGESVENNLRLRCRSHNQFHAGEVFGRQIEKGIFLKRQQDHYVLNHP